jgi:hypothetical protein
LVPGTRQTLFSPPSPYLFLLKWAIIIVVVVMVVVVAVWVVVLVR